MSSIWPKEIVSHKYLKLLRLQTISSPDSVDAKELNMNNTAKDMITILLESNELTAQQIRTIRQINHLLLQVGTTLDEDEFFKNSAEMMRLCASIIKQSKFNDTKKEIAYSDQAIEYSLEILNENLQNSKIVSFDN